MASNAPKATPAEAPIPADITGCSRIPVGSLHVGLGLGDGLELGAGVGPGLGVEAGVGMKVVLGLGVVQLALSSLNVTLK